MFRGIFVYKMFEKCQFWISKRHRTIHYSKEFESDLCDAIWELKILPKMYELISAFATQNFAVFESQSCLEHHTWRATDLINY